MNAKITASTPGSHLPPDQRSPAFKKSRQEHAAEAEPLDAMAGDVVSIESSHSRALVPGDSTKGRLADAFSFTQTQAGFLQMLENALDRMGELSVLCQDDSRTDVDRANYTSEFTQLQNFISDIGTKKFNGITLFSDQPLEVSIENSGPKVPLNAINLNAAASNGGMAGAYDPRSTEISTDATAATALANIQKALQNLANMQAQVGANIQRLSLSTEQLSVLNENLVAANGKMNDLDLAKSLTQFARFKMLGQSGAAMLAQANAVPQTALRLLDPATHRP
jgi:flagellin